MIFILFIIILLSLLFSNLIEKFTTPTVTSEPMVTSEPTVTYEPTVTSDPDIIDCITDIEEEEDNFLINYINDEFSDINYGIEFDRIEQLYKFIFKNKTNIKIGFLFFEIEELFIALFTFNINDTDFKSHIINIINKNIDKLKYNIKIDYNIILPIIFDSKNQITIYNIISKIINSPNATDLQNPIKIRLNILRNEPKKIFYNKFKNIFYKILYNECYQYYKDFS
jgi:hypothetical protein